MHEGYTVEEQVTGEAKVGGLQFDIFPRRPPPPGAFYRTKTTQRDEQLVADEMEPPLQTVHATPQELGLAHSTIAFVRYVQYDIRASRRLALHES